MPIQKINSISPGQRFGRLVAVQPTGKPKYWECECDCGNRKVVRCYHLLDGKICSCGCLRREMGSTRALELSLARTKTGLSSSATYSTWCAMKQRCLNPNSVHYRNYGERGITVCERWLEFENFLADMGERPPGMTLERRDNSKGYFPENCLWATRKQQQNNRRGNRLVTYRGKTLTLVQWSERTGIHHNTLDGRLNLGWPLKKVFSPEKFLNLEGLKLGGTASGAKKRAQTHCKRGHELTGDNVYLRKDHGKEYRSCRACHALRELERYYRRRAATPAP